MDNITELSNHMPWIVAFVLGMLTVIVNLIINSNQRKLALKNLEINSEISLKTINKDILSNNRQEWINTFRDCLSDYISSHELSKLIRKHDDTGPKTSIEYRNEFKTWQSLYYKMQLLLNPREEKTKKMLNLMIQLNENTDYFSSSKEKEYERIKNEIIKVGQLILKEEWIRVKNLE